MGSSERAADETFVIASPDTIQTVAEGIRRQMLAHGPDLMLCRVEFDDGAVGSVHRHPHSQATLVVSGRFRATVGGQVQTLGPGDSLYVQPDTDHGVSCLEAGVLIDAFTPAREDFLAVEGSA